uniref:Uncharacterized protein n=2 Tax=Amorphochlora amoebiformis TaxID=1561963 RepID=A0A7S0CRN8_9EUKA|mmetsp:Transcript_11424/g.18035  ORF Transcript_11424/g.18035 Transcript_11424/m.18035 type:complete len:1043 (+) Transcript_11424:1199-4327(+)
MEFARLIKKKIRDPKAKAPIKMYLEDHMSLSTMLVSPIADWNNPNSLGSFFQPKGANCIHPEIFLSLFSNVNGCHIYPRLKFLKDVMYLVVNRVENCESLMKFRNWQAWMLPLLFDIPADNSDDENTYTVLGKVRTYGLGILTVVIWHSATNPGPTALIDFAKQLRNSLALILAPCTDQSLDIANSLLSALVSRFFTDRVNLVVPSSCLPNKENVKSQEIIEELLHKWQCLLHLIRVILMVSLVVPPTVFNVNIVDNVTRQMRSLDKKNKQRSKSPAHSLRKPANSTPQGSKGSNASKDSQTSAGGSAGASAGASGGAGSTGGDPVSTSRDSKQESTSGHETWQSDVTSNLFLGLKLDSRDIPSDRVLTHMLMVVHHVQCEEESLEDSWSELTMSRFERKKERVHERSKNIRMQPEDMLAVLKRRITETKVADMPGQCGEGKIPNLGLMKKGGRGKATPLLYYGSSWKSKLKSSVDMLIKIQNLVYELKHRTKQDHLKSKALKQVMDSVFRHTAFVSDTIVFLRLLDSDLWRFLNEKKLRQLIMNFCKANDTHSRRKTFYNSQKEKEKDDKVQSKKLEKAIAEEKARADERYEILLLGPGQSGKSTIYKQLVHLHGDGFSTNDREKYRTVVYANIVGALKNIIYHATQAVERSDESVCKSDITVLKYIIQSARKNKKTDSKGTDEKTAARLKAHLENKQELEKLEKQYRNELIVAASSKEDLPAAMATRKRMAELTGKTEEESKFVKKWIDEYYDRFKYDEKLDECLGDIERQSIKSGDIIMSKRLHNAIVKVWNARASQEIYKRRAAFQVAQLDDSCVYFLNHISRILPKDRLKRSLYMDSYVPSLGDVLNCRKRTVGVINGKFTLETSSGPQTFQVIDVAGQRGARRKWIPFFNTCDCVLFVISLAGYNRYLLEQSEVLRMHEALTLFEDIVNQPQLRNTPFIVFLNKFDLFQEELKTTSITHCFPQYTRDDRLEQGSPEDVKLAVRFIRQQFMRKVSEQHRNDFYFHTTCATDTTQVEKIFSSVTDIIIQRGLAAAGLI